MIRPISFVVASCLTTSAAFAYTTSARVNFFNGTVSQTVTFDPNGPVPGPSILKTTFSNLPAEVNAGLKVSMGMELNAGAARITASGFATETFAPTSFAAPSLDAHFNTYGTASYYDNFMLRDAQGNPLANTNFIMTLYIDEEAQASSSSAKGGYSWAAATVSAQVGAATFASGTRSTSGVSDPYGSSTGLHKLTALGRTDASGEYALSMTLSAQLQVGTTTLDRGQSVASATELASPPDTLAWGGISRVWTEEGTSISNFSALSLTGDGTNYRVSALPVPEPESYALVLMGLGFVAWRTQRARKSVRQGT
jgi:hypothetical protein